MTRASQKTRDTARKHRMRRKKLDDRAKGLRPAGLAVTPPTRTAPVAPARPAAPARTPSPSGRPTGTGGTAGPRPPRAPRPPARPATETT
jgi:hypothetical protein